MDLTFFTSNATKLAHARYIAEEHKIKIKGFKQRTYHADYIEPRLSSRSDLLEASYRSALRQCTKAGIPTDSHAFILEDTSVRVDALSTETNEVPGLDIKFWMQEQSFERLDRALKERGNQRSASVRSDVLLHVPKNLRTAWGVDDEYIVFVGCQSGHVIDHEADFDSDLLYPWLDNKSFNKWFCPIGSDRPFGSLSIEVANKVDFRRKSFKQLFEFLGRHLRAPPIEVTQLELQLDRKPNLMLCGYTCAGKTTASQHLSRNFGYLHIEASDFMYLNYYYRHGFTDDVEIGDFAEQALTQKPEIAAEKVAEYIEDNLVSPVVVSGFRAPDEIQYLERALAERGKIFRTVFIDASEELRFGRLSKRMRPGDNIAADKFSQRDEQQRRMGLDEISQDGAVHRLENNGTISIYFEKIDEIVGTTFEDVIDIGEAFKKVMLVTEIKLEDAILLALLEAWKDDESRPFFTTTKIAKKINQLFQAAPAKHKDNVSRYFNQDFYALYEIEKVEGGSARQYRLSNTGYGAAMLVLRKLVKALGI